MMNVCRFSMWLCARAGLIGVFRFSTEAKNAGLYVCV